MLQVGPCLDQCPSRLGHFFTVYCEKPVDIDAVGFFEPRTLKDRWPEEGMEIDYVLANEMNQTGGSVLAKIIVILIGVVVLIT